MHKMEKLYFIFKNRYSFFIEKIGISILVFLSDKIRAKTYYKKNSKKGTCT